jgi:hypothetical protein
MASQVSTRGLSALSNAGGALLKEEPTFLKAGARQRDFWNRATDLPHGKSNPGIWAAANQPDGQITSDFQKWCQAPKSKIFRFCRRANQRYDSRHPVPTRGALRDRHGRWVRDAVDAAASGEQ